MPLEGLIVLMKPSVTRDAEDSPKMEEAAPVAEKQGEQNDAPAADENKDNKDATANEEEEKEEDKVTTYLVLSTLSPFNV